MQSNVVALTRDEVLEEWATFDNFWVLYPRRVAKRDAMKAWDRMPQDDKEQALLALPMWRKAWASDDPKFLPYPATYLNGARWEDELPAHIQNTREVQTRQLIAEQSATKKSAPPPEFLALLEKMRGKK